jgi:GDP-4-dehydro-6-deoxy-D-mannose reductase
MTKKYLITGLSGFVGRYFIDFLEQNEHDCFVMGVDIRQPDFTFEKYKKVKIIFEEINLLSQEKFESSLHEFNPDYILHLAAYSSVAASWENPAECFLNNTNAFLNLIEAVRKFNLNTRILSVGSSEEYGNVENEDLPLTENSMLSPINPYAVARMSQEILSKIYINSYGMDIILTRSFNHVGPGQKDVFVVSSLAKQLVQIKKSGRRSGTIVAGDLSVVRDFTDVRDVVRAYYFLLNKGRRGEIYNVCSGTGLSIKDILGVMTEILDIQADINVDKQLMRPMENSRIVGSNIKIKKELGWENNIPLKQSLKDIIAFWEAHFND